MVELEVIPFERAHDGLCREQPSLLLLKSLPEPLGPRGMKGDVGLFIEMPEKQSQKLISIFSQDKEGVLTLIITLGKSEPWKEHCVNESGRKLFQLSFVAKVSSCEIMTVSVALNTDAVIVQQVCYDAFDRGLVPATDMKYTVSESLESTIRSEQ